MPDNRKPLSENVLTTSLELRVTCGLWDGGETARRRDSTWLFLQRDVSREKTVLFLCLKQWRTPYRAINELHMGPSRCLNVSNTKMKANVKCECEKMYTDESVYSLFLSICNESNLTSVSPPLGSKIGQIRKIFQIQRDETLMWPRVLGDSYLQWSSLYLTEKSKLSLLSLCTILIASEDFVPPWYCKYLFCSKNKK